jgi:hypothetical protein
VTDISEFPDEILFSRISIPDVPGMDLEAYRRWLGEVTPPTDSQIEAFADFVAGAHSWYKHLPLPPPGAKFHFYIDPQAGMDRLVHASGEVTVRLRTLETEPFHYSWMATADYRERFGCLSFSCAMGSTVFNEEQQGDETVLVDNNSLHPVLQLSRNSAMTPPEEVLEAGTCRLTALVHPRATAEWVATRLAAKKPGQSATPGFQEATWAVILQLWEDQKGESGDEEERIRRLSANPAFESMVQQHRAWLRQNMIEAMQRMRSVAFPQTLFSTGGRT